MEHKFKKFQKVVYDGLVATIINCGKTYKGTLTYDLISDENEELTCIAPEEDCIAYNGEFIDQTDRLFQANIEGKRITNMVGNLTDSNFRDGNH